MTRSDALTVVGIGASAGGLDAIKELLGALQTGTGAALVLVTHQAPEHESSLPELLGAHSPIPVCAAADGMRLEGDRLYVMPPNQIMTLDGCTLRLRVRIDGERTPINVFFRSLAEQPGVRPIAVVLSGTLTDGAVGLREVKLAGGITLVQDPESARFPAMPHAAIATGAVDDVLAPAAIARELVRINSHPLLRAAGDKGDEAVVRQDQLLKIFDVLRARTGVDFSQYKAPTVRRRLQRRILIQRAADAGEYLEVLRRDAKEAQRLHDEILIHVTSFFREPESFDALREHVFPRITRDRTDANPIRIWSPGCATGEEAYSVAIELLEYLGENAPGTPVQIFATDISEAAVERARNGVYPESIQDEVSAARLRRYFHAVDGSYRVSKAVRDLCVFARQDLTRDPPFSRIDLIVCRNVLIYLGQPPQRRAISVFHYALRPGGFLLLGSSETTAAHPDLFQPEDKKVRLFSRRPVETPSGISFSARHTVAHLPQAPMVSAQRGSRLQQEVSRLILDRYSPPGVVVDGDMQVLHFRGHTGAFLEPAPGDASLNLLKMLREGLLYGVRTALHQAKESRAPARRDGLRVTLHGEPRDVTVEVVPVERDHDTAFLVLFEEAGRTPRDPAPPARPQAAGDPESTGDRADRLDRELDANREYLQSIIQDLEAANEELQSANEEILSSNEELQSTNEELDTAREELQSTNEELNTVNEELRGRNEELSRAASDLVNLLSNVQIAIVMVTPDLRIRRFTPMAETVLNLIPADIGRPLGHIRPAIQGPDLEQLTARVIEQVEPRELEVRDAAGRWYVLRVRPYKDADDRIDGAVLALFDIDVAKRQHEELGQARDLAEAVVQTVKQPLLVLDAALRVQSLNRAFVEAFAVAPEEIRGRELHRVGEGEWNLPELRAMLTEVLSGAEVVGGVEAVLHVPGAGRQRVRVSARRLEHPAEQYRVLVAFEPVDEG